MKRRWVAGAGARSAAAAAERCRGPADVAESITVASYRRTKPTATVAVATIFRPSERERISMVRRATDGLAVRTTIGGGRPVSQKPKPTGTAIL